MGFKYNKQNDHGGQDSMWTSYSDLFLGLSIIFLLLYVSASLKQGTDGIRQSIENKRLVKEAEDLKQQIKVYETLKQDYMKTQASNDEKANYEELMSQLTLLQDQAKDEKDQLRVKALENEKKEHALNKYQQMIRNIVNSNVIANARIKSRDSLIVSKDETITEKSQEISSLETTVAEKNQAIEKGENRIGELEQNLNTKVSQLQKAFKAQKISKEKFQRERKALEHETEAKIAGLRRENDKARGEIEKANQEIQETNGKLAKTSNALNAAKGSIAQLGQEKNRLKGELEEAAEKHGAEVASLDKKLKGTQGELAKARENLNAKKTLADKIRKNFAGAGVKADVDAGTGDVLLSFDGQYFDTGRSELKPGMRNILEHAMPAYSQSLFADPNIANKIQSVEIVGFASPTYKGKYVDPTSLDPENRQAVNYNLDLSYQRARSIFDYVFDKDKMAFKNQERLLPLVKVTGRSFLSSDKQRDPASSGEFCKQNDCAKLQRVVIKFTLKD